MGKKKNKNKQVPVSEPEPVPEPQPVSEPAREPETEHVREPALENQIEKLKKKRDGSKKHPKFSFSKEVLKDVLEKQEHQKQKKEHEEKEEDAAERAFRDNVYRLATGPSGQKTWVEPGHTLDEHGKKKKVICMVYTGGRRLNDSMFEYGTYCRNKVHPGLDFCCTLCVCVVFVGAAHTPARPHRLPQLRDQHALPLQEADPSCG